MGAAWRDWTGLPMVFAVWAARRDVRYRTTPGWSRTCTTPSCGRARSRLRGSMRWPQSAARWEDFEASALVRYFQTLDFSLGERQLAGLAEFARRVGPRIGLARFEQPTFADV